MKNENLYLIGGALLASTALTTAASAATLTEAAVADAEIGVEWDVPTLAVEVFPEEDADEVTIGGANFDFSISPDAVIDQDFSFVLRFTGASLATANTVVSLFASDPGASLTLMEGSSCTVAVGNALMLFTCTVDPTVDASTVAAIPVLDLVIDDAADTLATAGGEVSVTGYLTVGGLTFDELASSVLLTSGSAAEIEIDTPADLQASAQSDPQFVAFDANTTDFHGVLATVNITLTGAVGTNLAALNAAATFDDTDFVIEADEIVGQPGVDVIEVPTATFSIDADGIEDLDGDLTLQFSVAAADILDTFTLEITFDGETPIEEAAGGTITVTPTEGTGLAVPVAEASGATAGIGRGGLNVSLNYLLASGGPFMSYVRVTNTGNDAAPITITLIDAATGEQLGDAFETDPVPADGTLQVDSIEIEEGAGIASDPGSVPLYNVVVTGALVGYVQHILFNSDEGLATDLSGFRSGGLVAQ